MLAIQAQKLREMIDSSWPAWIGLVVALLALAAMAHWFRAWYRDGDDPADVTEEIVRQLEESRRRGDLSEEEFRSIKGQISASGERAASPDAGSSTGQG